MEELEGEELLMSLEKYAQAESVFVEMMKARDAQVWMRGETALTGVRTGHSARTERHHMQKMRERERVDAVIRES